MTLTVSLTTPFLRFIDNLHLVSALELLDVVGALLEAGLQVLQHIVSTVLHGGSGGGLVHAVVVGRRPPAIGHSALLLGRAGGLHPHLLTNIDIRKKNFILSKYMSFIR